MKIFFSEKASYGFLAHFKLRSTIEHEPQIYDLDCVQPKYRVPGPDALIEVRSIKEHARRIHDVADVSMTDVVVKVLHALEELAHDRHLAGIQDRDIGVGFQSFDRVLRPLPRGLLDVRIVALLLPVLALSMMGIMASPDFFWAVPTPSSTLTYVASLLKLG